MSIQEIEQQVEQIVKSKSIKQEAIFSAISAFLETNYVFEIPDLEIAELMQILTTKILKTIYRKERHKLLINPRTDFNSVFGIDSIELKYLERTLTELESKGLLSSLKFELSLTDKGVMEARKLR